MLLQQQLQEVRGEIKAAPASQVEARPVVAAGRANRVQATNGSAAHGNDHHVATVSSIPTVPVSRPSHQTNIRTTPSPEPKSVAVTASGICNSSNVWTFRILLRKVIIR